MDSIYLEFFETLPKHALVPLIQLVPNKFEIIDTKLLAYVFVQHGILKKKVTDNLKEAADKIVKQQLKTLPSKNETSSELKDMQLSKECEYLIKNFLYFKNKYSETITSDVITTYISYIMISDDKLKCFKFFDDCLYVKEKQNVKDELYLQIYNFAGSNLSEVLKSFGEYLTDPLFYQQYDCSFRDKEIQDTLSILCRLNKCNVILVGNPGVGKTTIVNGICNIIQSPECPKYLQGYNVFALNINKIMSGTTYRGDLEKRLDDVLTELKKQDNVILFIDEIHTLFSKDGELSPVQNVLKPYLTESSKVIGCTTNSEYKTIESDKAFERRFSIVRIEEMSELSTIETIEQCKQKYEEFHNVTISRTMIQRIVSMCSLYIKNRYFPDKAFDILDKSCVRCKLLGREELSVEDVENTVYEFCNINPTSLSIDKINNAQETIKEVIIGQEEAINTAFNCIRRYCIGVNDKRKPIGNLLFVGPTGTGKTELCKQIANKIFTPECFIRFDMSEFMESHSVSKLIGSPPGYVGFNQGGSLTELVKHNPFSVILFDEIEKAHKDVINILLQIMDDGRLTDSFGTTVDFCNCLIVMTSNIGCKEYMNKNTLGFSDSTSRDTSIIKNEINNYFRPEFLNRLTKIIYFNTVTKEVFTTIFDMEFENFIRRYRDVGIELTLPEDVKMWIKSKCFDEKNGVRFVKNKIESLIENELFCNITNDNKNYSFYLTDNKLFCKKGEG